MHAASPAAPRLIDRAFRWRGSGVSRLESFTDAVFAIVLALLFLRATPSETFAELEVAMSLTGCTDVRQAGRELLVG